MIQHSFAHWAFGGLPGYKASEFMAEAKAMGYSGVEMLPEHELPQALEAGLELVNLSGPGMTQGFNRLEHHSTLIPQVQEAMRKAKRLNAKAVIIFSGNRAGQDDREGIAHCALGLQTLLPLCDELEIELHFEMLNSENHQDYQASSTKYGLALWEKLAHPRFRLLYDVYHMEKMGEPVLLDLKTHHQAIGHVHCAANPDREAIQHSVSVHYRKVLEVLENAGYCGYLGQEFIPPKGSSATEALEELRGSLEHLKSMCV